MTTQTPSPAAPTARLADWAAALPREDTHRVRALAIDGIRDLVACLLGGSREPSAMCVTQLALAGEGGRSTIVGHPQRVSAAMAALANGTAAHVLDFDDSFAPLTGHPSAPILSAVLALAEAKELPGRDVIDAYVVGLEITAAIGRELNPSHYALGWHSTATIGVVGAAAACARLLRLDADGIAAAISIAASSSSGTRMQLGHPMKSVHAGLAARNAVEAAQLAALGMRGHPEPLADARGLLAMYSAARPAQAPAFAVSSAPFAIESPGLTFKPYPTCGSTHRSLDGLLHLRQAHDLRADEVESAELVIPAVNAKNLVYDTPRNGMEARFSMPYCAAVALLQGRLRLSDFDDDAVQRPQVTQLMRRIRLEILPGSEQSTKDYLELPAHTHVRLKSGRTLTDTRYARRGSAQAPMGPTDRRHKFMDCASRLLAEPECRRLDALLSRFDALPDLHDLMALLRRA